MFKDDKVYFLIYLSAFSYLIVVSNKAVFVDLLKRLFTSS